MSYRSAALQLGARECSTVAEHSEAAGRHRMLGALLHVLPDVLVEALVTEPEPLDEPVPLDEPEPVYPIVGEDDVGASVVLPLVVAKMVPETPTV